MYENKTYLGFVEVRLHASALAGFRNSFYRGFEPPWLGTGRRSPQHHVDELPLVLGRTTSLPK